MASMEMWAGLGNVSIDVADATYDRRVMLMLEGDAHSGYVHMTPAEAIRLRDDLSRVILEIATEAARAAQEEKA